MTHPGATFRFDANGCVSPEGHTVTKVVALAPTAVTFSTTLVTPLAGTPPTPTTTGEITPPGPTWAFGTPPVPSRVSNSRAGVTGWYRLPCTAPCTVPVGTEAGAGSAVGTASAEPATCRALAGAGPRTLTMATTSMSARPSRSQERGPRLKPLSRVVTP
jgi:hypothetical protein